MTKIVLDTNVLISATFWKGPPNQVTVLAASGRINHFTSKEILDEYAKILERDFRQTREQIKEKLDGIISFSKIVQPSHLEKYAKKVEKNNSQNQTTGHRPVEFFIKLPQMVQSGST